METKTREQHLSDQISSGQTVLDYCAHHSLKPLTFYKWRSLARKRSKKASPTQRPVSNQHLFKELLLPNATLSSHSVLEYRITRSEQGFALSIPQGFSQDEVQSLLSIIATSDKTC